DAKDKVMMGAERRSMVMTEDEKKMTAYHEAGHAIVAVHEPASDPIHKATIIPRGRALGMVMRLPERDNYSYHRDKMHANHALSARARADIAYSRGHARDAAGRSGMADKIGPPQYEDQQEGYLGMGGSQRTMASDETNKLIDAEIRALVHNAHERARTVLTEH